MMQVQEKDDGTWWAWDEAAGAAGIWVMDHTEEDAIARFERAIEIEKRMRKENEDERKTQP